jgi:ATP-dependent Zn protease
MRNLNKYVNFLFVLFLFFSNRFFCYNYELVKNGINHHLSKMLSDFRKKINYINSIEENIFMTETDKFDFIDNIFPEISQSLVLQDLVIEDILDKLISFENGCVNYKDNDFDSATKTKMKTTIKNYVNSADPGINLMIQDFKKNIIDLLLTIDPYKLKVIISKTDPTFQEQILNNKSRAAKFYEYYQEMTKEQKDIFYKKLDKGYPKYMLDVIKKNAILLSYLVGTISVGFITISFLSNLFNTISNNLMQPFFNRWGKHKNFLAKLEFENITNYNLESIAGYSSLKKQFLEIANELMQQKIKLTKIEGICLHGEPGNGKTQIVKALAGQAGIPIVIVNLNTLLNENGQIEENLNLLFEEARKKAPCIILLDEFDLIAGSRKLGKLSDSEKSILNEMLQQLDGGKNPLEGVLVVANTNVINNIDFALQRPGRLGRVIEVKAPEREDIKEIIKFYLKKNQIKCEVGFTECIIEKLLTLPKINVAMIKNYIQKIKQYMGKNKVKNIIQNDFETIINQVFI